MQQTKRKSLNAIKKKLIFRFSCKKREQHKYLQEYKLEIKEKFVFLSLNVKGVQRNILKDLKALLIKAFKDQYIN